MDNLSEFVLNEGDESFFNTHLALSGGQYYSFESRSIISCHNFMTNSPPSGYSHFQPEHVPSITNGSYGNTNERISQATQSTVRGSQINFLNSPSPYIHQRYRTHSNPEGHGVREAFQDFHGNIGSKFESMLSGAVNLTSSSITYSNFHDAQLTTGMHNIMWPMLPQTIVCRDTSHDINSVTFQEPWNNIIHPVGLRMELGDNAVMRNINHFERGIGQHMNMYSCNTYPMFEPSDQDVNIGLTADVESENTSGLSKASHIYPVFGVSPYHDFNTTHDAQNANMYVNPNEFMSSVGPYIPPELGNGRACMASHHLPGNSLTITGPTIMNQVPLMSDIVNEEATSKKKLDLELRL